MLPKENKLPTQKFRAKSEKTLSSPYFLMKIFSNNGDRNRLGIIISNSTVKKSVDRHYWKRRFSEYFRKWPDIGRDFLVIASKHLQNADERKVKSEFESLLAKLGS